MKEQETKQERKAIFKIEGDFYLIVDPYNYSIAKYLGKRQRKRKNGNICNDDNYDYLSFHPDIIKALESYCRIAQKEKAYDTMQSHAQAGVNDIKELMINLSAETKRLADTLKSLEKLMAYQSDR